MDLTGHQVKMLNEFMGGDYDCNVTLGRFVQERIGADGETMPAGLYVWCSDYPEEGSVHLPEVDPDSIGDESDYPNAVAAAFGGLVQTPQG